MNHPQVKLWYPPYEEEVEVDEKLAPFLELLWKNGVYTMMSCQDTPHPGKEGNVSCGRVWLQFPTLSDAVKFLKLCVPHPPTADFEADSLYNRVYIYYWPEEWPRSCLEDVTNTPVEKKLWTWSCNLTDVNHCTWDDDEVDKFLGPPWPDFDISVRFPFEDIELLTKNIEARVNEHAR